MNKKCSKTHEPRSCKVCGKGFEGNAKKVFCSTTCRVYSHRKGKWYNINDLNEEQWKRLVELWKRK